MKRVTLELIVGIFVLVGILCLAWLSIKLGQMELLGGDHYQVSADFDSVSGLKKGATVEIAGVEVGQVDRIELDSSSDRARVYLRIRDGVKLQDDVIASVRTSGIIGDKFIKLKPGGSDKLLANGGRIRDTESAVDLEELLSKYIHGNVE
ncbi:outer membrane lipid asymmetry maintenance protein MlaD [Geobacter sulfurreducens]|uniref:outer membrane lipid asymmetry maintenance protein MlaD n=1 Tax=Geobacter sulfurreducens TaxID=35554 RepID=UPI000DBB4CA3|nr:outer membrane lipid asymmetry maintenance protein MlaD [Geobacter sulfurreducens]BBA69358.1 putative phospholipid ABC transporter-binding protein MlaD [Geobacter sulfurreducens]